MSTLNKVQREELYRLVRGTVEAVAQTFLRAGNKGVRAAIISDATQRLCAPKERCSGVPPWLLTNACAYAQVRDTVTRRDWVGFCEWVQRELDNARIELSRKRKRLKKDAENAAAVHVQPPELPEETLEREQREDTARRQRSLARQNLKRALRELFKGLKNGKERTAFLLLRRGRSVNEVNRLTKERFGRGVDRGRLSKLARSIEQRVHTWLPSTWEWLEPKRAAVTESSTAEDAAGARPNGGTVALGEGTTLTVTPTYGGSLSHDSAHDERGLSSFDKTLGVLDYGRVYDGCGLTAPAFLPPTKETKERLLATRPDSCGIDPAKLKHTKRAGVGGNDSTGTRKYNVAMLKAEGEAYAARALAKIANRRAQELKAAATEKERIAQVARLGLPPEQLRRLADEAEAAGMGVNVL